MKIKKRTIILVLLITIFTFGLVSNSLANPVVVDISLIKYNIANLDIYDDYVFIIYFKGDYKIISLEDMPFLSYKEYPNMCAIKKDDFNESEIGDTKEEINNFFESNPKVIKINFNFIYYIIDLEINNPPEEIVIELKISSINESIMELEMIKIFYHYEDNTIQEYTSLPAELEDFFPNYTVSVYTNLEIPKFQYWLTWTIIISSIIFSISFYLKKRKKVDFK